MAGSYAWADGSRDDSGRLHGGRIRYFTDPDVPQWPRWPRVYHERTHAKGWNKALPMEDCPRCDCIMTERRGWTVWLKVAWSALWRWDWLCPDCRAKYGD
jgi:hypothetical protein